MLFGIRCDGGLRRALYTLRTLAATVCRVLCYLIATVRVGASHHP